MKNTAKRSAASRKAWRTRKRMKAMRGVIEQARDEFIEYMNPKEIVGLEKSDWWPKWKQRALPNPWMQ